MFTKIRNWYREQIAVRKAANYRRGYDYAAGALVRGEETPASLSAKIWHDDRDEFDRGMMDAAREMVFRGLAEDPESLDWFCEPRHLTPMDRRHGFDCAIGALLRGEETPSSLRTPPKGEYETGIVEAIEQAIAIGLAKDDTGSGG